MTANAWVRSSAVVSFLVALNSPSAFAGGVRIVEATGTQNFATIQEAVDAAPAGAVLLVGEGSYPGFSVNNKSLSIFAVPGAAVDVGTISIYSIDASQDVVVSGFSTTIAPSAPPGLQIQFCSGPVHVQDCDFHAQDNTAIADCDVIPAGGATPAWVYQSTKVAFSRCSFTGGKAEASAGGQAPGNQCKHAATGGHGLIVNAGSNVTVALYDCQLQGGAGGDRYAAPGQGGAGALVAGSHLFASNCTFTGGEGGAVLPGSSPCGGFGGSGISSISSGTADEIGSTFQGACGAPGADGNFVTSLLGPARVATLGPVVQADLSNWSIAYQGAPGDRPLLLTALGPQMTFQSALHGAWLLRRNTRVSTKNFGLVDASGAWNGTAPTGELVSFSVVQRRAAQVAVRTSNGVYLGSNTDVVLLNRDTGPDCDGNGVNDFVDVIEGNVADLNHNLIPDSCPGG